MTIILKNEKTGAISVIIKGSDEKMGSLFSESDLILMKEHTKSISD